MNPLLAQAALSGGQGLFSLLAGDPYEKYRRMGLQEAMSLGNTGQVNPSEVIFRRDMINSPRRTALAEESARRFGIDSGRFVGALGQDELGNRSDLFTQLLLRNADIARQNKMFKANFLGNYGG